MNLLHVALCLAISISPAAAMDNTEELQAAVTLGTLIGSESVCELSYDQAAITAWITTNVPPERAGFAANLQMMTMGQKMQAEGLSGSALTAHCASVAQSAKHLGFTK